jgi:hypothetical protein
MLAIGAEMSSSASQENAADGGFADQAWFAGAQIDPMLELEEAADAAGIDIIGYGGATELDGMCQHLLQGDAEAVQLFALEAARHAFGADSGTEEAFVGVDVADAVEELLVEQGCFDGQTAAMKEPCKLVFTNNGGLGAGAGEGLFAFELAEFEATEAAGIDEAHLATAGQGEPGVGVRGNLRIGRSDEEAAGHAEMNNPFRNDGVCSWRAVRAIAQADDDMFADALHVENEAVFQSFGLRGWFGFEGLFMGAEPGLHDAVSAQTLVDTPGNRLDFRQFRHLVIVDATGVTPGAAGNDAGMG